MSGSNASSWTPAVDPKGLNKGAYEKDLVECRGFAEADPEADAGEAQKKSATKYGLLAGGTAVAATVVTGGLALLPIMAGGALLSAGGGVLGGAMAGKTTADYKYRQVVTNCLKGRGYSVLG